MGLRGLERLLLTIWNGTTIVDPLMIWLTKVKVDACTIMRDASGTSRGFAFLTFEDPSAVDVVVGREHVLDGKNV